MWFCTYHLWDFVLWAMGCSYTLLSGSVDLRSVIPLQTEGRTEVLVTYIRVSYWVFQLVNLSVIKGDLKIKHCKAFPKLTIDCFTQQDEENPLQTTGGIFFFFPSFYFPLNLEELIKQPIFLKPTRDTGLAEVIHCKKCQTQSAFFTIKSWVSWKEYIVFLRKMLSNKNSNIRKLK